MEKALSRGIPVLARAGVRLTLAAVVVAAALPAQTPSEAASTGEADQPSASAGSLPADSPLSDIMLEGIEVRLTSGTTVLQRITAEEAVVDNADGSLIGSEVKVVVTSPESGEEIVASCPQIRYYMVGYQDDSNTTPTAPPRWQVEDWTSQVRKAPGGEVPRIVTNLGLGDDSKRSWRGDMLLADPARKGDVLVTLGERGELSTSYLLWSEKYLQFVAVNGFSQRGTFGAQEQSETFLRGDAFATDEQFTSWKYYVLGNEVPIAMEFGNGDN